MSDELDLVQHPPEWDDSVTICNLEFPLREFTMKERHLWLKIRRESSLMEIVEEFRTIQKRVEGENKSIEGVMEKRITKLQTDLDVIVTTTEEWTDQVQTKVEGITETLDNLRKQLEEMKEPGERRIVEVAGELQAKIDELKLRQQDIFLEFIWNLAKSDHKYKGTFEDFVAEAKGSDRQAAQMLVEEGNFTWDSQPNREARRSASKRMKN
jgi:hypothetical protein